MVFLNISCRDSIYDILKGKSILGWYIRNHLNKMVKEPKVAKSFSWALFKKCFHCKKHFSCLFIECLSIWLEVYFGIKNMKIV
jgi:hypothetical protein